MGRRAEVREQWRERIAAQERSGLTVRAYCKEQDLHEHSFYGWRQRLRAEGPVSFALVETKLARTEESAQTMDLVLKVGERLRIALNESALRLVLKVLRTLA